MKINRKDIELMSPAGSYESLMAAINAGADSVYFGAGELNMRARSSTNFSIDDIKNIAGICRDNGVKSYLTLNIVVYDNEIAKVHNIIDIAKESKIDAVIASDLAVINYCKEKEIEVHASTQLNVSNIDAIKFFSQFTDVIVLARELNLEQVFSITEEIQKQNITGPSGKLLRIEMFAHGALCMSVSGKCYLSLHEYNASANRGACYQTCRRKYNVTDKDSGYELEIDNEYIMSPKDLCTIDFLDKILGAGVKVLKLEGRGRAPDYVKRITECYNEAIYSIADGTYSQEKIKNWLERLATVFNRGFWGGYYLGKKLGQWSDKPGSHATRKKIYVGKATHYFNKIKVAAFAIEADQLNKGDKILITGPTTGAFESIAKEIRIDDLSVEQANKGETISLSIDEKIRPNDKLYKYVDNHE